MKLLLDVDGVLAPFGRDFLSSSLNDEFADKFFYSPNDYIYYSPENTARLARLAKRFEIHWCTGWEDGANTVFCALHSMPKLPVCPILEYSNKIHWKLNSIEAYVQEDEPYAFVDDDITEEGIDYANSRTERGVPTLWLPTRAHEGLIDAHVRILENWLDAYSLLGRGTKTVETTPS